MDQAHQKRYSDINQERTSDFYVRKMTPSSIVITLVYLAGGLGLFLSGYYMKFHASSFSVYVLILLLVVMGMALYGVLMLKRFQDMLTAAEFQNALFASAAGLRSQFSLIVRANGSVAYYSPGYMKIFSHTDRSRLYDLETLLAADRIPQEFSQRIREALANSQDDSFVCPLQIDDSTVNQVRFTIAPISRPKGFLVISVSDAERRKSRDAGDMPSQNALHANIATLQGFMEHAPVGVYLTDIHGKILYVNATLEQWLGYGPGSILSQQLQLQQIIQEGAVLDPHGTIIPDSRGMVAYRTPQGEIFEAHVEQHTIYNDHQEILGHKAIVLSANDQKKNL
jgi:PAS domain S-box-containing protein